MAAVKSGKLSRSERALQTRRRILGSARELFLTHGYAATTMERIADDAGVAVQTLYYSFKTKGHLLCELVETTAAGEDGPAPGTHRPWMQEVMGATTGGRILALAVEHGADVFSRAAPLWPTIAAAAADPTVDRYWKGVTANRRAGQARMVARLSDVGALRDGLSVDRATDIVVTLFGHDVFRSLVSEATWSIPEYKAWLLTALAQQLLERPKLTAASFSDLSYAPEVPNTEPARLTTTSLTHDEWPLPPCS